MSIYTVLAGLMGGINIIPPIKKGRNTIDYQTINKAAAKRARKLERNRGQK